MIYVKYRREGRGEGREAKREGGKKRKQARESKQASKEEMTNAKGSQPRERGKRERVRARRGGNKDMAGKLTKNKKGWVQSEEEEKICRTGEEGTCVAAMLLKDSARSSQSSSMMACPLGFKERKDGRKE